MNAQIITADEKMENNDYHDEYDNMLDEISTVQIGSLEYSASRVLKEVDDIAYYCGYNDYVDSLELGDSWECGECGDEYDTEEEASECCQEEEK